MPCHAMPCYATPCHAMIRHAATCYKSIQGACCRSLRTGDPAATSYASLRSKGMTSSRSNLHRFGSRVKQSKLSRAGAIDTSPKACWHQQSTKSRQELQPALQTVPDNTVTVNAFTWWQHSSWNISSGNAMEGKMKLLHDAGALLVRY